MTFFLNRLNPHKTNSLYKLSEAVINGIHSQFGSVWALH